MKTKSLVGLGFVILHSAFFLSARAQGTAFTYQGRLNDTPRFNRRHQLFGHLFSGRYKSLVVDGSGNG